MLLLVHHAETVDPAVDSRRPLSARGGRVAEALAAACAARGVRPDAVWHSGKLRARQTAEAFWHACNPLAEFAAIRGLQPGDPPDPIRDLLAGDPRDLVIVGHMPHIEGLLQLLVSRDDRFPDHGVAALEPESALRWTERWRLGVADVEPASSAGGASR